MMLGLPNSNPPSANRPWNLSTTTKQQMSLDPHRAAQVPNLNTFACWAFGPHGLPNLQVLAHGDFSHDGRYVENTFIFGRDGFVPSVQKPTFWAAAPKSEVGFVGFSLLGKEERNEVMARYGAFLEACPVDPLVGEDGKNIEAVYWSGPGNY